MKILAVDIGTGTQDIMLFDTRLDIENAYKLILPAPTLIIRRRIQRATHLGQAILLEGTQMGGGPSAWAAEDHIRAGYPVFATAPAALSFDDDLNAVRQMGIQVISEDEARRLPNTVTRIHLHDFNFDAIQTAFAAFGVSLDDLAALAIAVFDHGAAPTGISDRQFRFDYLDQRIREHNRLSAFAYQRTAIPAIMTRLQAVADSAGQVDAPLIVMDTAPAAVLGAALDPHVAALPRAVIANVGNFHTLAFRLGPGGIEGVFEHHTGLLTFSRLEKLLQALADGSLRHQDVFDDHGHGALIYDQTPLQMDSTSRNLVVAGPRRGMLLSSALNPYFAVPFGDMMTAGCFGLLEATADLLPDLKDPIFAALHSPQGVGRPPWEIQG